MTASTALRQGFSIARRVRPAVWVLFLINLGLAALAALPIYRGILRFTGYSLMSEKLLRGLPVDWLTDFSFNSPGSFDRYATVIAFIGIFSIPVNTLLAGGVLASFREPAAQFSLAGFARATVRYGWRLLRLMILGLICYWIVFRVLNQSLGNFIEERTYDWQSDRTVFALRLGADVLTLAGLGFVNLVMDFARVKLVLEDAPSAVEAFLASLGFSLARLRRAVVVYAIPSLAGLALLGIYRLAMPWSLLSRPGTGGGWIQYREPMLVALLFFAQQVIMFGRYWFRVATWASEWSYYAGSGLPASSHDLEP